MSATGGFTYDHVSRGPDGPSRSTARAVGLPAAGPAILARAHISLLVALAVLGACLMAASAASAAGTSGASQWATDVTGGFNAAGTMTFGTSALTAAIGGTTSGCGSASANEVSYAQLTSFNANAFYTPPAPTDAVGVSQCLQGPGGSATRTVTFNRSVIAPVFNIVDIDASTLAFSAGPSGGAVALTTISKNAGLNLIGGTTLSSTVPQGTAPCSDAPPNPANNPGCGSFRITEAGGPVTSFTMTNATKPGSANDGWFWSLSFPTVPLTKAFSPSQIPVGGTSTLTFTIANPSSPGQPTMSPLDFTDVLPSGVTLANATATSNGNCGTPSVTDSAGGGLGASDTGVRASNVSVAPGVTCTITINVTSTTPGSYINDTSNLSTSVVNLVPNANTSLTVSPLADVKIEKSASSMVVAGRDATYSLKVTNNGPSAATNVRVSDPLPSGLSFASASPGCTQATQTVTCTIASLTTGSSQTFNVTAHVASSADSCADVRNTSTVTSDTPDPDTSNNSASVCDFERRADLSLTKTSSDAQVPSGGQAMYTLVVKNNGPGDATGVKISDPMAAGLSLVSAKPSQGSCSTTGGKVSCDLGSLRTGGSVQVLVTAQMTASSGCVTNTATVTGDNKDTAAANDTGSAKVCVPPGEPPAPSTAFDLVVSKTANDRSVYVGESVTYTVTVANTGAATAPSTDVTDVLNAPASVVSVKASQGSCTKNIPMTCQVGAIPAGGKVTITVVVKLRQSGCRQRNAASATAEGTDANPANNLARVDACVKAVPLRLTKVADSSSVRAGGLLGYTIRVSNRTAGEARDVKVCDRLPSGMVYVSSSSRAKLTKGQYCWTLKTLAAHKTKSYRITVRTLSSASGSRVNRATASAPGAVTTRAKDPVRVLGAHASGGGVTG
jgi:uncharacterized repeat protein (TIGR01451 family)